MQFFCVTKPNLTSLCPSAVQPCHQLQFRSDWSRHVNAVMSLKYMFTFNVACTHENISQSCIEDRSSITQQGFIQQLDKASGHHVNPFTIVRVFYTLLNLSLFLPGFYSSKNNFTIKLNSSKLTHVIVYCLYKCESVCTAI